MPSVGTDIVLAAKFPLPPHSSSVPNSLQRTTCFFVQEMNAPCENSVFSLRLFPYMWLFRPVAPGFAATRDGVV